MDDITWTSETIPTTGKIIWEAKSPRACNWAESVSIIEGEGFSVAIRCSETGTIGYVRRKTLKGAKRTAERMLSGWWWPKDILPEGGHEFWAGTGREIDEWGY